MAKAEDLKKAVGNKDIPVDVVPDHNAGGKNYGQELVNQQPAGTYKYGAGPSTYSTIAPGTKTLAAKQFDLNTAQFEEQKRSQSVAEQLALAKAKSGGGNSGSGGGSGTDGLYQATINEMLSGQTRHRQAWTEGSQRTAHNYNSYITTAINLSNGTLSSKEIESLRKQADYLADQDAEWTDELKETRGLGKYKEEAGITGLEKYLKQ